MIGQGKHGRAVPAPIIVDCLRVTAMEMKNALLTLCVEVIIASVPFHLLLTVVLNLKITFC